MPDSVGLGACPPLPYMLQLPGYSEQLSGRNFNRGVTLKPKRRAFLCICAGASGVADSRHWRRRVEDGCENVLLRSFGVLFRLTKGTRGAAGVSASGRGGENPDWHRVGKINGTCRDATDGEVLPLHEHLLFWGYRRDATRRAPGFCNYCRCALLSPIGCDGLYC